jgi:hypothetical protein
VIAPGSGEKRDLTLAEIMKIVKDDGGPSLLNEVIICGGHVKWQREETHEEALARVARNEESDARGRQGRYDLYLRLKAEFEGEEEQ